MLIIIVTLFMSYLIYGYAKPKITCSNRIMKIYFVISIIMALGLLEIFINFSEVTSFLWCIYIPVSLSLFYIILNTMCIRGKRTLNLILWIKYLFCLLFLIICLNAYYYGYICVLNQETASGDFTSIIIGNHNILTVLYGFMIGGFFWLFGEKIFCHIKTFSYHLYITILILTPFLMFFILEISCNPQIGNMNLFRVLLNIFIMMFFEIIVLNFFNNRAYGLYVLYSCVLIIGVSNHFVVLFRNNPIMPVDILSIKTALSVSNHYQYYLTNGITLSVVIFLLLIGLISSFNRLDITNKITSKKEVISRKFLSVMVLIFGIFWIHNLNFENAYSININFWWPAATYESDGFAASFITFLQKLKVQKPDEYSIKLAENILINTSEDRKPAVTSTNQDPTIIVVMNESFSDLSALGPLECADRYLKNYNSLKHDTNTIEHGLNYVSTRGGGTSTTEFEFLTGNSMSNLPGSNPYAQFNFTHIPNIIKVAKAKGYKTIAMHPEDPNNWRRSNIYADMGFDEFLSLKDFEGYETTVWNRISDLGDYKKLIDVYESQEQPALIFNVTMQNHGGYDIDAIKEDNRVSIDDNYSQYLDVQAYESLIYESDNALGYLMNYFSKVDKPVIICFFGDHQPVLDNEFESELVSNKKEYNNSDLSVQERYYAVPYFIWSNYKIDNTIAKNNTDGKNITSTNYLGYQVQYYAGFELSNYGNFLLSLKDQIPVINFIGYLGTDNQWYSLTDDSGFLTQLNNYQIIQYYAMFDKRKNIKCFEVKEP